MRFNLKKGFPHELYTVMHVYKLTTNGLRLEKLCIKMVEGMDWRTLTEKMSLKSVVQSRNSVTSSKDRSPLYFYVWFKIPHTAFLERGGGGGGKKGQGGLIKSGECFRGTKMGVQVLVLLGLRISHG